MEVSTGRVLKGKSSGHPDWKEWKKSSNSRPAGSARMMGLEKRAEGEEEGGEGGGVDGFDSFKGFGVIWDVMWGPSTGEWRGSDAHCAKYGRLQAC